jgi:hypothetical protein
VVCCFVMVNINNNDDIEQYIPVMDLEQDEWNFLPIGIIQIVILSLHHGDISMGDVEVGSPEVADSLQKSRSAMIILES